jgi:hypothetical protein
MGPSFRNGSDPCTCFGPGTQKNNRVLHDFAAWWLRSVRPFGAEILRVVAGPLLGFIGLFVGAWLTRSNESKKRRLEFFEKQLRELYGPLWGLRQEIQALSNFRLEVEQAHLTFHEEHMRQYRDSIPPGAYWKALRDETQGDIDYNNKLLQERLLPHYRLMRDILREKMWLADADILDHWPTLVKFIDTWDRSFETQPHPSIVRVYQVKEQRLNSLYRALEERVQGLRAALVSGEPDRINTTGAVKGVNIQLKEIKKWMFSLKSSLPRGIAPIEIPRDSTEHADDREELHKLIEGYRSYTGNVALERVRAFPWAVLIRHESDRQFEFRVEDDNGDDRTLQVLVVRPKSGNGNTDSQVRVVLE